MDYSLLLVKEKVDLNSFDNNLTVASKKKRTSRNGSDYSRFKFHLKSTRNSNKFRLQSNTSGEQTFTNPSDTSYGYAHSSPTFTQED